jgi:hypothetical protein
LRWHVLRDKKHDPLRELDERYANVKADMKEALADMNKEEEQTFDELFDCPAAEGALCRAVIEFGLSIFSQPEKFKRVMKDLLPTQKKERSLLLRATELDIGKIITRICEIEWDDEEEWCKQIGKADKELHEKCVAELMLNDHGAEFVAYCYLRIIPACVLKAEGFLEKVDTSELGSDNNDDDGLNFSGKIKFLIAKIESRVIPFESWLYHYRIHASWSVDDDFSVFDGDSSIQHLKHISSQFSLNKIVNKTYKEKLKRKYAFHDWIMELQQLDEQGHHRFLRTIVEYGRKKFAREKLYQAQMKQRMLEWQKLIQSLPDDVQVCYSLVKWCDSSASADESVAAAAGSATLQRGEADDDRGLLDDDIREPFEIEEDDDGEADDDYIPQFFPDDDDGEADEDYLEIEEYLGVPWGRII